MTRQQVLDRANLRRAKRDVDTASRLEALVEALASDLDPGEGEVDDVLALTELTPAELDERVDLKLKRRGW